MADTFGALLRETRIAAGISLGALAQRINYSKGYVSKIENGRARPNAMFAKLCDRELDTGGALSAVLQPADPVAPAERDVADDGVWVMELDESGEVRIKELPRRQVLAGAGAMLGIAVTGARRPELDERTFAVLRATFDQHRVLGTMTSPRVVLAQVVAHLHTLRSLAADNPEPMRTDLLLLASRVAEYAGWMSQEAGDKAAALRWTERAVTYAAAGRDPYLASFAQFRRAEIALYQNDPLRTVALARRAQDDPAAGPRILGLAARVEAQGHALAGDVSAYQRALDRAADLLATRDPGTGPVLGSASVTDEVALARGWSLYDLGRPREAAEILDRQVAAIPLSARRARTRFDARRALAHAMSGDVDQACTVTRGLLDDAAQVDSATIRMDLGDLVKTLRRWHNDPAVRELYPDLVTTLNPR
jgi:transcriptional regulator with XRE-family HTH domain/tetratricopeptide (TPR) repeat protein